MCNRSLVGLKGWMYCSIRCQRNARLNRIRKEKTEVILNLDGEEWREIEGYPAYSVSNMGRIKSKERYVKFRNGKRLVKGQIMKMPQNFDGYHCCMLRVGTDTIQKSFRVHRLVAAAFIPNPNNLPVVNHINGIKTDNRVENLEWVTSSENAKHAFKIGLRKVSDGARRVALKNKENWSVSVINIKTGETYPSILDAANVLGVRYHILFNAFTRGTKTYKNTLMRLRDYKK